MSPWVTSLIALTMLATPATPVDLLTEDASPDAGVSAEATDTGDLPFSASVLTELSVGRGTFVTGPAARPYVNLYTELYADYTFEDLGLVVGATFAFSVNLVENADSGNTVPHQVRAEDLKLSASIDGLLTWDEIGLEVTPSVSLTLPTSLASQHVGKIVGIKGRVTTVAEPFDWLSVEVGASMTKNLNLYTTGVLDAGDFSRAPLSRVGGAEAIASSRISTGSGATSWYGVWGLGATLTPLKGLSFLVGFEMLHLFSYQAIGLDEYSSPYAHEGRGQTDLMYGTLEASWEVFDHLSLALGSLMEATPLTDDNTSVRFPFWDTTNGSANRQVFYLDVTGSF